MDTAKSYNEQEQLKKIAEGDEGAFATLFHAWRNRIYFFTLQFTQSPQQSEDIVQEVFIKLWLHRAELQHLPNFQAWVYKVIKNHAISGLRRIALETNILAELRKNEAGQVQTADEELLHKQLQQKMLLAIQQLPPRQKEVYTLTRIDGLKQEEVAERLHLSISTVQNHMTEALKKLRIILSKEYPAISAYFFWILLAESILDGSF